MTIGGFLVSQFKYRVRYNRILRVLIRHGFNDYVAHLKDQKGFSISKLFLSKRRIARANQYTKWERMRMVCEELGPTFIKFGQILSNRHDLLPPELITELIKLQDSVPPFPGKKARQIIESEFGNKIEELLSNFEEVPFASASMAQVHKAVLKSGEEVVLKIQRPGIRKTIDQDIVIMREVVKILAERMPSIQHFDPVGLVNQFSESVHYELDFIHESINLKRFEYNFREDATIQCPKVYNELTSTKVVTMEMVDGYKPLLFNKLKENNIDRKELAKQIIESFFTQVFEYGFFHADPHAGNILVKPDGNIYFIDFGMMGTILRRDMEHLGNLILAIQSQDVKMMMTAISVLTNVAAFDNKKRLQYDLIEFVNKFAYTEEFHLQISQILVGLTNILRDHHLQVPSHFFLLTRAMFAAEGLVRELDPDIVLMDHIQPVIEERIREDRGLVKSGKRLLNSIYELGTYMEDFPSDLRQTMRLLRKGKFQVNLQHQGTEPFVNAINRSSRQIVAVMLVSALLLGSSVFVIARTEPQWNGIPIYSIFGVIFAGIIGIILLIQMFKKEKEHKDNGHDTL